MIAVLALASYLVGAIPTSFLVAKYVGGIDLREHGSRNLGATNLYRVLGGKFAYPAGLLDIAKGAVPVVIFPPVVSHAAWVPWLFGILAIVGHVFPVYLGFKGGKGVATAAGVGLGIAPLPLLASLGVWAALLLTTRIMSAASIAGAVAFPLFVWLFDRNNTVLLVIGVVLAGFIAFTHRANIRRLLAGTEPKLVRAEK
jgi:glycerol-3-phosphate acyltransferase PlsY